MKSQDRALAETDKSSAVGCEPDALHLLANPRLKARQGGLNPRDAIGLCDAFDAEPLAAGGSLVKGLRGSGGQEGRLGQQRRKSADQGNKTLGCCPDAVQQDN